MKLLSFFITLLFAAGALAPQTFAEDLPFELFLPKRVELGQPFVATVRSAQTMQKVRITWMDRSVEAVVRPAANGGGTQAQALLGTDVLHPPQKDVRLDAAVTIGGRIHRFYRMVPVAEHDYPAQRLKVAQKYVAPPPKTLERIARESKATGKILRTVTPARFWKLPLSTPINGRVSSVYGLRRFFNGEPRRPHRGLDLAAPKGTPVAAAEDGVVLMAANHYFAGNSIYLDHGEGVVTAYFHLSEMDVKAGQIIKAGEIIGKVGSTGRVTGPHLHFGVYVQGQAVDPAPLLDAKNWKNLSE